MSAISSSTSRLSEATRRLSATDRTSGSGSGTRFRLTRDRGQWWYDISRDGADLWLDVDGVAGAMGSKSTIPVERVADLASSIDDRVFVALSTVVQPAP